MSPEEVRVRRAGLQGAMECALIKPWMPEDVAADQLSQIRYELTMMYGPVTDDEVQIAARRVLAVWRPRRHIPGARPHLDMIEANWARLQPLLGKSA